VDVDAADGSCLPLGVRAVTGAAGVSIIDADVHNSISDLSPYLPEVWRDRWKKYGKGVGKIHFDNPRGVTRHDATPPDGGAPASDPVFLIADHLDRHAIDYAILTGPGVLSLGPDPDYSNAICRAYNDYMIDRWLPVSARFKGSVLINPDDPPAAVAEIRRVGVHSDMVQVLMSGTSRAPYGQRQYHPIYEAASELGLPIAMHPGTEGSGLAWPPTPVGYPTRYMEWHNILPLTYMAQVNSFVCEGVFERFPSLKGVVIEGGVAWLAHLMWRMDKNFKALRDTAPWLTRLPSDYVKDHIRLTTQPIEEPENPDHFAQVLDMISAERTLMFSSDYPHWDADNPTLMFRRVESSLRERIFARTAADIYRITDVPSHKVNPGPPKLPSEFSPDLVEPAWSVDDPVE
jgi:predicted TIM-barrel fold metal-dependent hydrolase